MSVLPCHWDQTLQSGLNQIHRGPATSAEDIHVYNATTDIIPKEVMLTPTPDLTNLHSLEEL